MASVKQVPAPRAAPAGRIGAVAARMREIGRGLPPQDGVAVFHRTYLSVTEELERRPHSGHFEGRATACDLRARLAARYTEVLAAERDGGDVPACWRPLFRFRRHPSVHPSQFALAGLNAHIGHDLPLALLATCRARGAEPEDLEADFERLWELLTGLEERIREHLMPGPDLLNVADPLTYLVGSWSLERARGGAWGAFRALWGLRDPGPPEKGPGRPEKSPGPLEEMTKGLDATVGLAGRCLLTPLPGRPRAARGAAEAGVTWCAEGDP